MTDSQKNIAIAISWCLAWGDKRETNILVEQTRKALIEQKELPPEFQELVNKVEKLQTEKFPLSLKELKEVVEKYAQYWNAEIGLVYGGATKIKQYVFEAAKLPDIRGASALLDRINLVDLPAFFHGETHDEYEQCQRAREYCQQVRTEWLDKDENFPELSQALIPELIIYSTGGNILSFCPAAYIDDLANAIEKRYTEETLTANSCAVGDKFKLLEIKYGLLPNVIDDDTFWIEKCVRNWKHELIKAYFEQPDISSPEEAFQQRKTFNELAGKLASLFNQRRNGNDIANRPSRRYPPMFETHPYIVRDEGDRHSAVIQAKELPNEPWFSEASARKRLVGQISKLDSSINWYDNAGFIWNPGDEAIETWVNRFERFLYNKPNKYFDKISINCVEEARNVREIGDASNPKGFVAYIYADGNNMGGYIQKFIKNPEDYKQFSKDIFDATETSVYAALMAHLIEPHKLSPHLQAERNSEEEVWIHPFEILTIGGDDVMLIVPADKALAIAKTIGEEFESRLAKLENYKISPCCLYHRYQSMTAKPSESQLSMSTGVLITAEDTPIYYAQKITEQLLKSAKKQAKELKKHGYFGGTVDFLVMKSVTMISSNISEFRSNGLTKTGNLHQKLNLYAAPYTLHELGGLLTTAKALKEVEFPKSQLYQIRSLLARGKQTAILNYLYFRARLSNKNAQKSLKEKFEDAWCKPKDPNNGGNLAPWMSLKEKKEDTDDKVTYETIWRELVDLYPFIEDPKSKSKSAKSEAEVLQS